MKIEHQLRSFESILEAYDHSIPLHRFLPAYFKKHKNMGSSDRRWATRYIYSFFRLGNAIPSEKLIVRLAVADFLCNVTSSLIVSNTLPEFEIFQQSSVSEKLKEIKKKFVDFNLNDVFQFHSHLSLEVENDRFQEAHFVQPDVFIAASDFEMDKIEQLLDINSVGFKRLNANSASFPNATKLETVIPENMNYRIQDLSSQKTAEFMQPNKYDYWWDCCAASGGKSLLLFQQEYTIQLLVSDNRASILQNLALRFQQAGLKKYQSKVLDLLQNNEQVLHHYEFDGIILDVPCSGSGTWGRTPEMLVSFKEQKIHQFSSLQKNIASNVIPYLKSGKPLVYITCSVFKEENEDVVQYLLDNFPLKLERKQIIKGYANKADSMFAARLIKQ